MTHNQPHGHTENAERQEYAVPAEHIGSTSLDDGMEAFFRNGSDDDYEDNDMDFEGHYIDESYSTMMREAEGRAPIDQNAYEGIAYVSWAVMIFFSCGINRARRADVPIL